MHTANNFNIASLERNSHKSDNMVMNGILILNIFAADVGINGVKMTNLINGMYDRLYLQTKHIVCYKLIIISDQIHEQKSGLTRQKPRLARCKITKPVQSSSTVRKENTTAG